MRYLVLWAGQKILFGLWFLTWPVVVWRWTRQALYLPSDRRKRLRGGCLIGGIFWGGCVLRGLVDLEVEWIYGPLAFYIPWGIKILDTVDTIVQKHKSIPPLEAPKEPEQKS